MNLSAQKGYWWMASESMGPAYVRKGDNIKNSKVIKPDNSLFLVDLSTGRIVCNKCGQVKRFDNKLTKDKYVEDFKRAHKGCAG